jgi:hypothetical protein
MLCGIGSCSCPLAGFSIISFAASSSEFVDYIYLPFMYLFFLMDLSHLETMAASGGLVGERHL